MKSGQEDYNHWIDIKDLTDTITFVPTKSNVNFDELVVENLSSKDFLGNSIKSHSKENFKVLKVDNLE